MIDAWQSLARYPHWPATSAAESFCIPHVQPFHRNHHFEPHQTLCQLMNFLENQDVLFAVMNWRRCFLGIKVIPRNRTTVSIFQVSCKYKTPTFLCDHLKGGNGLSISGDKGASKIELASFCCFMLICVPHSSINTTVWSVFFTTSLYGILHPHSKVLRLTGGKYLRSIHLPSLTFCNFPNQIIISGNTPHKFFDFLYFRFQIMVHHSPSKFPALGLIARPRRNLCCLSFFDDTIVSSNFREVQRTQLSLTLQSLLEKLCVASGIQLNSSQKTLAIWDQD